MNGGSSAPHLACTPCVPLFSRLCLMRAETEGLSDSQGWAWDHPKHGRSYHHPSHPPLEALRWVPKSERSGSQKGGIEGEVKRGKLRPERPFTGVCGPSGPKIAKKSQKESFWGSAKKSPEIPEKVKNTAKSPIFSIF